MADDLNEQLLNNKLQLQQVEAALEIEKDKPELIELRTQLLEVIELTCELLGKSMDEVLNSDKCPFRKGDICMAMSSSDRHYYRAIIEDFMEDGTCQVTFSEKNVTDVCPVTLLKPFENKGNSASSKKKRRDDHTKMLEKKRAKALKRLGRMQQIEQQCEKEKHSWQNFNKKMKKQGKIKKSIFASPDSNIGKVGVGTCGVSGKPMTQYDNRRHYLNN